MHAERRNWHTLAQLTALTAVLTGCPSSQPSSRADIDSLSRSDAGPTADVSDGGVTEAGRDARAPDPDPPPITDGCGNPTTPGSKCSVLCDPSAPSAFCGHPPELDPTLYACGDGTPECMQLCDELCAVGPACGREAEACLTECREELRCPGETPGMDIAICDGYASHIESPQDTCLSLDFILRSAPADPAPLCVLAAHGARFEGTTGDCLSLDGDCTERLALDAAGFRWSQGLAQDEGSLRCEGDQITLEGALGTQHWDYDPADWTLTRDDGTAVLQLVEPSYDADTGP